jgi:hypothetical protein
MAIVLGGRESAFTAHSHAAVGPPPPSPASIAPPPPPSVSPPAHIAPSLAAQVDVTDQIAKLAHLRDVGALTEEEFSLKKAELLARL